MTKIKAAVYSRKNRQSSKAIEEDPFLSIYDSYGIIPPPFNMSDLANAVKISNTVPQCIQAMEQNCEGFGYNLVEIIKEEDITPALRKQIDTEKKQVKNFFDYASYETSFTKLRKKVRGDMEKLGNGYIEVIRNTAGKIAGLEYVKSIYTRMGKLSKPVDVDIIKKDAETGEYTKEPYVKRFRTFVQQIGNEAVFFKELGDPRDIDSKNGNVITSEYLKEAEDKGEKVTYANEIIHSKATEDAETPYGIPRWVGNIVSIAGSRSAEEVNSSFFDNKAVPPLAMLISGGTLDKGTHDRIKDYINSDIKGKENFHSMLIIEAEGSKSPHSLEQNQVKIELKELSQIKEGMFLAYDKENRLKLRSTFRLSPLYIGLTEDFNYATSRESKVITEEQVFGPEKLDFDFMINRKIFPELGIKYLRFETKSAPIDNMKDLTETVKVMNDSGLTNAESRKMLDKIAGVELDEIKGEGNEWLGLPMRLAQVLMAVMAREQAASGKQEKSMSVDGFIEALKTTAQKLREVKS